MKRLIITFLLLAAPAWAASDSCTDADGTALATHDANWTQVNSTYAVANLKIASNKCTTTSNFAQGSAYYNASSVDTSQIVMKAATSAISGAKFVAVRMGSSQFGYSAAFATASGGNWTVMVIRKNNSFYTSISGSWAMASDHTVKITVSGTSTVTINVTVDGTDIGSISSDSSSPIGSGHPGFYETGGGTAGDQDYDDWTDGASGAAAAGFNKRAKLTKLGIQ